MVLNLHLEFGYVRMWAVSAVMKGSRLKRRR